MTIENDFREAVAAAGLPATASLDDLIRHHRANAGSPAALDAISAQPSEVGGTATAGLPAPTPRQKPKDDIEAVRKVLYRDHGHFGRSNTLPPGFSHCKTCDRRTDSIIRALHGVRGYTVAVTLGPNEMLLRVPVVAEYEDGDWEHSYPGYWYASARDLHLIADNLDEKHAALLSFETEGGEPFPDGFGTLNRQMQERFESRREAYTAHPGAAQREDSLTLVFPED